MNFLSFVLLVFFLSFWCFLPISFTFFVLSKRLKADNVAWIAEGRFRNSYQLNVAHFAVLHCTSVLYHRFLSIVTNPANGLCKMEICIFLKLCLQLFLSTLITKPFLRYITILEVFSHAKQSLNHQKHEVMISFWFANFAWIQDAETQIRKLKIGFERSLAQ